MAGAQTHMALAPRFGLPPRALDCLRAITRHVEQHKSSPSYDDLATALGLSSKSGVVRLVTTLEERGYIRKLSHRARSIEIIIGPPDRPAMPHTLPDRLENSLLEHCRRTGEKPADVVADAVALFLDQAEADPA